MRPTFGLLVLLTVVTTALFGCNQPPPEKTVFDPQVRALKKAKGVEAQLQQGAAQRREETEAATADPAPAPNPGYDVR